MSKDAKLKEETSRKVASAHHLLHCFSMPLHASTPSLQLHVSDHLQCFLSRVLHQGRVLRQLLNDHPDPLKTWILFTIFPPSQCRECLKKPIDWRHWIKMSVYYQAYSEAIHSRQAITTSTHTTTFRILHTEICIPFNRAVLWLTTLSDAFTHWSLAPRHHCLISLGKPCKDRKDCSAASHCLACSQALTTAS